MQLFQIKYNQYQLLTGPRASEPEIQYQAQELAREAARYHETRAKYLNYIPAI